MKIDVWSTIFTKGLKSTESFSPKQKQLYNFIDFHISIEMDGASGFLYNRNFEDPEDNLYEPYIECLRFFHYDHLADLLQQFSDGYIKGLRDETETDGTWAGVQKAYGLAKITKLIQKESRRILGAEEVTQWIDQHYDELVVGLI